MGLILRLLTLLGSARNTREAITTARHSVSQIKNTAEGFRTASFQRTLNKATQGDPDSQYDLAEYYYDGRGVPKDYGEAFQWFRRAAEQGHGKSQVNVGMMFFLGRGVETDVEEACRWLSRAVEQRVEGADRLLEKARERGDGR